jgi:hypothetical protein
MSTTGVKEEKILKFGRSILVVWHIVVLKHVSLGKAEFIETRINLVANWSILSALDLCKDLCNICMCSQSDERDSAQVALVRLA